MESYSSGSITELNASTGALVRVLSAPEYHFDVPDAVTLSGPYLFVANLASHLTNFGNTGPGLVTEVAAATGALVRALRLRGTGSPAPRP